MNKTEHEFNSLYRNYEATRFTPNPDRARVWATIISHLEKRFGRPRSLLELGAGYCDAVNASGAARKYAVDIRPEVETHAAPGVNVHIGSCCDLSWLGHEKMDWIFASNLFEHLTRETLSSTLAEAGRVLAADGILIVIQPNFRLCFRSYFDDYTHLPEAVMTDISMADYLTSEGFQIVEAQARFLPFSLKSRLPRHPSLVRMYLNSPVKPFAGQMLIAARRPKTT